MEKDATDATAPGSVTLHNYKIVINIDVILGKKVAITLYCMQGGVHIVRWREGGQRSITGW